MTTYSYWEGPSNPLIELCLQTMHHNVRDFRQLNHRDVAELGGQEVLDFAAGLPRTYRSDLIRFWLLKEFGGYWLDADCIVTRPLNAEDLLTADAVLVQGAKGNIVAPYFGGRKGHRLMEEGYRRCRELLTRHKAGQRIQYGSSSVGVLNTLAQLATAERHCVAIRQHWRYDRVAWYNSETYLRRAAVHVHEASPAWSSSAIVYHLTNKPAKILAKSKKEALLHGDQFASFLFQRALCQPPAVPLRSKAILDFIARTSPQEKLHGVEIGVNEGTNASHLLFYRPALRLSLVDPWRAGEFNEYTGKSNDQHNAAYTKARSRLDFAGERAEFIRSTSAAALERYQDNSLDFAFIDGNHSYEATLQDIKDWSRKVSVVGWIGGHDYGHVDYSGVKKAVDEFVTRYDYRLELGQDYTWFVQLR